ncbi:MAG: zinc-ribbon domain-containing protein [Chitinophagaceae bacterium]|nr:zinc-ribbon domain-containing protein [Chitinophagaceae bacterium]
MSFCTKCGKQNTDTAKFCTSCGGALTSIQQPVNSKNNLKIIISVTSLVVVAACYFLFFHKKSNPGITSPITTDTTTIQQPEPFAFKSSYDLPKELVFPRNWEKKDI